jgi:DNA mismatch repair protein MutS2
LVEPSRTDDLQALQQESLQPEGPRPIPTEDERLIEESRQATDRLSAQFLREIPKSFRYAARELEFEKIFLAHCRTCSTPLGKQALVKELRPKLDPVAIDRSLQEVRELRTFLAGGENPGFGGLADIGNTLRKLEIAGSTMYVEEGARVLQTLKGMRALREYFARRAKDAPTLWKAAVQLYDDRMLEMHFDQVFDDAGKVKDSASTELHRIRREILQTADILRAKLSSILRKLADDDFVQEDIITQREGRFVLPVKVEHKRRVPGFIHSVSQSGQTVFVEPSETLELNNELRSLEFAEQREIDRILRSLAELIRDAIPALRSSLAAAGHLEAVSAKASYALRMGCNDVVVDEQVKGRKRSVSLKDARHPILLEKLGREKTVPLSLELDEDRRTLVLTGPNAGGKTVLIKTVGLLALMAQAGIPIPAAPDGRLPMMDGVYVEIGDMQSIADDLSTFSSHVKSLAAILSNVTRESLVLLDEIGGGTAPEEGGAIGESILEHLTRIGAVTIATTHYGRLAAFAEVTPGATNGSMEFSGETLTPTFRFRMGVPGSSHAFDIAERYGLKHGLVNRARELRGDEGARIDELVNSLEILQRDARDRKAEAERELGAARITRVDFERKRNEIEDIRKTAKGKATAEAEEILKRANTFVERAVREAKEAAVNEARAKTPVAASLQGAPLEDLRSLRMRQEQERKKLMAEVEAARPVQTPPSTEKLEMAVGANVKLKSNPGQVGSVLSMKGNEVEIEIGSLRMRTKKDQLEVVSVAEAKDKKKAASREISQATKFLSGQAETRIDLRGEYGDDAVMKVDRFLADAIAHSLARVEIIHGIGTGALGRRISQHLKGHEFVQSYRFGEPQEGGGGVTIVELK